MTAGVYGLVAFAFASGVAIGFVTGIMAFLVWSIIGAMQK